MADDFCWKMIGTTVESVTYQAKESVLKNLMKSFFNLFADLYTNTVVLYISEFTHSLCMDFRDHCRATPNNS